MKFSQEVWKMPHSKMLKRCAKWIRWIGYAYGIITIVWPAQVFATTGIGVLPWDQPLNTIQNDLQGTVAHAATTIAVIAAGLTWTFSEHGTGARKMSAVALGGAGALGATQLITALFPFAPALF
jgi:type IV secretory pathway VirB2 component (pilin)